MEADKKTPVDNGYESKKIMVDNLLAAASSSIDSGNYEDAITGFEQVVEISQDIFGDNTELGEIKSKIREIQEILKNLDK